MSTFQIRVEVALKNSFLVPAPVRELLQDMAVALDQLLKANNERRTNERSSSASQSTAGSEFSTDRPQFSRDARCRGSVLGPELTDASAASGKPVPGMGECPGD